MVSYLFNDVEWNDAKEGFSVRAEWLGGTNEQSNKGKQHAVAAKKEERCDRRWAIIVFALFLATTYSVWRQFSGECIQDVGTY